MIFTRTLSIIVFIFAIGCSGQHQRPLHYINNHLENGDSITLQIEIYDHKSKLFENNITMLYTLDQPQIKFPLDVPVSPNMDNLTIVVHLLSEKIYNRKIYSSFRNLTKYSKYRNTSPNDSLDIGQIGMQMGVNHAADEETLYGLHIADRFSILVLHHQSELPYDKMYFDFFNIKAYNKNYVLAADLSQMQIPFKNYVYVPEIKNSSHTIQFSIKIFKFTYYQMLYGLTNKQLLQKNTPMLGEVYTEEVIDSIKYFLFQNNLYLILLYFILSMTQTFMQIFAFKNEIKIWKDIKNKPGLSIKVLYQKFICEIVILCYLIIHDSNKLYIFFQLLDLVLTLWKIKKAFTVSISRQNRFFISFKYQKWYSQKIEKVDQEANKFSYKLLAFFSIIFAIWKIYTLRNKLFSSYLSLHETGLGSISIKKIFIEFINTAAFYIFIFGFVMMTPQLFINYKLKSVAHLPWKTLIYRFISTIIDDVFILMIDVPTLNVMLCFRDDVIFVLYLIQRRLYPVDSNRKGLAEGEIRVQGNKPIQSGQSGQQSKKQK